MLLRLVWSACVAAVTGAYAWRLFPQQFKDEGMVRAGALGLDDVRGEIGAWGYFRDDRFLDMWIIDAARQSVAVHEWNHAQFRFNATPSARVSVPGADMHIVDVVAADYTYNGVADLLVMAESRAPWGAAPSVALYLWPMHPNGTVGEMQSLPASTLSHPMTLDAAGSLHADLFGHAAASPNDVSVWRNYNGSFVLERPVMLGGEPCRLAHPHSSAFVDMNGDCLADLFLVCAPSAGRQSYQVWAAQPATPMAYTLVRTGELPPGTGALSFADMNRDGTIDVVFASCDRSECYLNIAYNEQMPLCSNERSGLLFSGSTPADRCRDPLQLCEADDAFVLDFRTDANNSRLARMPLRTLTGDAQILLDDDVGTRVRPVPVRIGDYNNDGYPDVAVLTTPQNAVRGETRVHLLESRACKRHGGVGCGTGPAHRTFAAVRGTVLDDERYVRSVSFIDLDEDGSLDMVLQSLPPASTHATDARAISFVQNNYLHDAFFLKALTLNAACGGAVCERESAGEHERGGTYAPWGGALAGASYKFAVLDPNGVRRAQQVAQQPQTAYGALATPYALFGLGRTNNYVESLFVGSTRRQSERPAHLVMEGVIPNSEVMVIPRDTQPDAWRRELFLHPADWVSYVTLVLALLIAFLSLVVFLLDLNEKHEDERERRRAVHAINFDAL